MKELGRGDEAFRHQPVGNRIKYKNVNAKDYYHIKSYFLTFNHEEQIENGE